MVVGMTSKSGNPGRIIQPTSPIPHLDLPPAQASHAFAMRFTSTHRGARLARRLAAVRLDAWGIPFGTEPHDEIVLIVAELTANAVRHGHVPARDFHLRLRVDPRPPRSRTARIEVSDTHAESVPPRPAALRAPGTEEIGGRGLLLVAGLAARWDWHLRSDGPGKTVWAEYALTLPA
jgi:anti-sigma regulatory factor (Ser/Thr protein kinase)